MNAEHIINLADALRSYALNSGHDLNASNLFVHTMLVRAINIEADGDLAMHINHEDYVHAADQFDA